MLICDLFRGYVNGLWIFLARRFGYAIKCCEGRKRNGVSQQKYQVHESYFYYLKDRGDTYNPHTSLGLGLTECVIWKMFYWKWLLSAIFKCHVMCERIKRKNVLVKNVPPRRAELRRGKTCNASGFLVYVMKTGMRRRK